MLYLVSTEVDVTPFHLDKSLLAPLAFGDADGPVAHTPGLALIELLDSKEGL